VVTGYAAFIESHPTSRLLANGHPVVSVDSLTERRVRELRQSFAGDGISAPRRRKAA